VERGAASTVALSALIHRDASVATVVFSAAAGRTRAARRQARADDEATSPVTRTGLSGSQFDGTVVFDSPRREMTERMSWRHCHRIGVVRGHDLGRRVPLDDDPRPNTASHVGRLLNAATVMAAHLPFHV
jgi:hypothetical protein